MTRHSPTFVAKLFFVLCLLWGLSTQWATAQEGSTQYLPLLLRPDTGTSTPIVNPTATPTATPSATLSATQTATSTATSTPTSTATSTSTSTATATATATPTIDPALPPIFNGNFEDGPGVGWIEESPTGNPVIVQVGPPGMKSARAGGWFVWLGNAHNLGETVNWQSRIIQSEFVTLPAGRPTYLHLNYQIISEEEPDFEGLCIHDLLNLWIRRPSGSFLFYQAQICNLYNTNGWTPAVFDLSSFAGQPIALEFQIRTNFSRLSHVLIDDVEFR